MLSIRTQGAQNPYLGPEVQFRNRKYLQKCSKWSEMPWNLFLSEKCVRKVVVVKTEVVVYFGLLLVKSEFGVAEWEKRVAAIFLLPVWRLEPPGRSFFALFWPVLSRYRTSTARNALYKKTGCTKSKSVAREYNSETGSTFKSARNGPKSCEIDCNSKNVVVKHEVGLQNRK